MMPWVVASLVSLLVVAGAMGLVGVGGGNPLVSTLSPVHTSLAGGSLALDAPASRSAVPGSSCGGVCASSTTAPLLNVSELQSSMSGGGRSRRFSELATANVENLGGNQSVAEGVTVTFYLVSEGAGSHDLGVVGGSPANVVWYGVVGGVRNASSSFGGGSTATLRVNTTYTAELTFAPPMNLSGAYDLCANATATNENPGSYPSGGNVDCVAVSFPHGFGGFGSFLFILIIPIIVVIVIVAIILRRRSRREQAPPTRSSRDSTSDKPEDSDLSGLLSKLQQGPPPTSGGSSSPGTSPPSSPPAGGP